jgi:murein L,D-transpeptidase YcbB/YkuD
MVRVAKYLYLFLCLSVWAGAEEVDPRLAAYQDRYSVCHETTEYRIAECLINGNLDFSRFRGDRSIFRHINSKHISEAVWEGRAYAFTMGLMPRSRRYINLMHYIDYLYAVKDHYLPPRFQGNVAEDIVRIKRVLNLLQFEELEETPEITYEFEEAILAFQRSHGLEVDGKIGPQTKRALKEPIGRIIAKVKKNLTLERLYLPKPPTYIQVNIPEFKMHFYRDGIQVLEMKTVVGKPKMRTPLFYRKMKFIVLNPTWNVPPSIYAKEYAHKSPEQLQKLGLHYNNEGKLYQPSGKKNALGLVKFLFPNRFNVYMHDTPAKSLFRRTRRAFSHGCIRLERPMDLLHELGYEYRPGKTQWITLEEQIPVYIEYHTVWVDDDGVVQFRPDVYGYEWKLFGK